jgi:hypothetical protein
MPLSVRIDVLEHVPGRSLSMICVNIAHGEHSPRTCGSSPVEGWNAFLKLGQRLGSRSSAWSMCGINGDKIGDEANSRTANEIGATIKEQTYSIPMFQPEQSFNGSMKSGKNTPEGNIAVTTLAHNSTD